MATCFGVKSVPGTSRGGAGAANVASASYHDQQSTRGAIHQPRRISGVLSIIE